MIRAASHRSQCGVERVPVAHAVAPVQRSAAARTTNSGASSGPPPREQPADERAADDHAVGRRRRLGGLLGRRDADAEQHRLVGRPPCSGAPITLAWLAELLPLAGDAHQRDAVDEARATARRSRASRSSGVVGAASSTVSIPAASAASPQPSSSSSGRSGTIAASTPPRDERRGEALVTHVLHRVVIRHHDERDVDVELAPASATMPAGRRADVERPLRRLLDRAAVHHRIRERDADLDRVGAGRGDRAHDVEPAGAEPAGDVGDEQLVARVALAPAGAARASLERLRRSSRSATCVASLSPRPESVTSTVEPCGHACARLAGEPADRVRGLERRHDALGRG